MSSTFTGFSDEDLKRIKSGENVSENFTEVDLSRFKKIDKMGVKPKRFNQYKLPIQNQISDESIDSLDFEKCKLSLRSPSTPPNNDDKSKEPIKDDESGDVMTVDREDSENISTNTESIIAVQDYRKSSIDIAPDIVRGVDNYTEDDVATHKEKLEELQLRQKLMEEQNKKRKEMLAKALADRTKQTEEEVMRLEKIKKELQVIDGQFSQDVAVLRKRIDQACLSYADAEKHYLRVEKEFLQAKINLQKEKEKKELLTEHLCALITHNETRKAQKLETLMLELASDKKLESNKVDANNVHEKKTDLNNVLNATDDENPVIIDGVDQRSGKMVEFHVQN